MENIAYCALHGSREQARVAIQGLQAANLLRSHAEECRFFRVGEAVEARYRLDLQWYKAEVVGRKGDRYVIRWEFGSRPHMCAVGNGMVTRDARAGDSKVLPQWSRQWVESGSVKITGSTEGEAGQGKGRGRSWQQEHARASSARDSRVRSGQDISDLIKESWDLRCVVGVS